MFAACGTGRSCEQERGRAGDRSPLDKGARVIPLARFSAAVDEEFEPLAHVFPGGLGGRQAEPAEETGEDDAIGFAGLWLVGPTPLGGRAAMESAGEIGALALLADNRADVQTLASGTHLAEGVATEAVHEHAGQVHVIGGDVAEGHQLVGDSFGAPSR